MNESEIRMEVSDMIIVEPEVMVEDFKTGIRESETMLGWLKHC